MNKCVMIMDEVISVEEKEELEPQESGYSPRPAWQLWAARIGLVLFILVVIYEYLSIARGGLF